MSDYRETFVRKEVKYRLSPAQSTAIKREVESHLDLGLYGDSTISSLYFDTPNKSVICRSLEKPLYKEKLRIRWYSDTALEDAPAAFLEMKKKFDGVVYKRRVEITTASAKRLASACHQPEAIECVPSDLASIPLQQQIVREIEAYLRRYPDLQASALIKYKRKAYEEGEEAGLRITFDDELVAKSIRGRHFATDIRSADSQLDARSSQQHDQGRCGSMMLLNGGSLMEIKAQGPYPTWLVDLLSSKRAYPTSFSKYGELYKKESKKERLVC